MNIQIMFGYKLRMMADIVKLALKLVSVAMALMPCVQAYSYNIKVYGHIPSESVRAEASSAIGSSPASNAADGSGMRGGAHVEDNLGEGMRVSMPSESKVRYNQDGHTRRGLKKVFVEWSADGREWTLLKDGKNDWHMMPSSEVKDIGADSCEASQGYLRTGQGPRREFKLIFDAPSYAMDMGNILSLKAAGYVSDEGLDGYLYTSRVGADPRGAGPVKSMEVLCDGPVAAGLRVICDAPGCNSLIRVIVYRVDVVNALDKQDVRDFENVRFVFPFNFPHPELPFDMAMSEVHPEMEQLAGANKQYYCVRNGLSEPDLSGAL